MGYSRYDQQPEIAAEQAAAGAAFPSTPQDFAALGYLPASEVEVGADGKKRKRAPNYTDAERHEVCVQHIMTGHLP